LTSAEIEIIAAAVERRLAPRFGGIDQRFDRLEKKIDDLADLVQGMATGHATRCASSE
jgi:hypothetical protein